MFAYNSNVEQYKIISSIVQATNCQKYLELGISTGINMKEVSNYCSDCTGVDVKDLREFKDFKFCQMSTDDFFKINQDIFDVIFIDADHSFKQVQRDFINSLRFLNTFGIIFLHDTDPVDGYATKELCGDSYKIIDWIDKKYGTLMNIITIPVSVTGLSIVNRKNDRRLLQHKQRILWLI